MKGGVMRVAWETGNSLAAEFKTDWNEDKHDFGMPA